MRSFTFESIPAQEFDAFSATHPLGNFQQTTRMGNRRASDGIDVRYVGVREDGKLISATQLEIDKGKLSKFAFVRNGPLCDFSDEEATLYLLDNLRSLAKSAGATELDIWPELPYRLRDSFGGELPEDGPLPAGVPFDAPRKPHDDVIALMERAGFAHGGFTTGYGAALRWRYAKDLRGIESEDELLATYTKNTRRDVRIARESFVTVKKIGRDDLGVYHDICQMSCDKQGFDNRPVSYFESIYDALGDRADFMIAYIDMPAYLASWEQKRDALKADIDRFEALIEEAQNPSGGQFRSTKKVERQLRDAREKYESALRRIETARNGIASSGELIPAAVSLFVWHERECVYLYSGADQHYAQFCASTLLQHEIMLECLSRGVDRYNFYGINGVFDDKTDPGRGLLEFKQGFGGYVEQMLGEFSCTLKPVSHAVQGIIHKVLGR